MPADEIIKGLDAFTEQPLRREYIKGEGWQTVRTWEGPQDQADSQEALILLDEPDSLTTTKGVPATIEARWRDSGSESNAQIPTPDPSSEEQNAVWQLIGQDLEKDLASHGYFNVSGISPYMMAQIDADIRKGVANKDYDTLFGLSGGSAHMNTYRNLRMQGVNSYLSFTWIIRKTITTSDRSLIRLAQLDVGAVITYTQLEQQDINGGAYWKWDQPKLWAYNVNPAGDWGIQDVNQWLTKPFTATTRGPNKWDIEKEWWGAITWDTNLYRH